jgi:class 3 adenylate cyclase
MQMSSAGTPSANEQRLLAAIVFTDVAGFSRLAARNESRAYQALQRDMDQMKSLCRSHNGQVLNTMGDGMLMSFSSAVDAMSCAIQIQQTLASQASTLPLSDVLHHRIGVHLGDVIVKGDDVFGDGVNTASRLQTEARPDSIWYSDAVQQVVNNKLKFTHRHVGPRTFKNLGAPVKVWEVPPVAELVAQRQAEASGAHPSLIVDSPAEQGLQGGKAVLMVVASVVLVGMALAIFVSMRSNWKLPDKKIDKPTVDVVTPEPVGTVPPAPSANPGVKPSVTPAEAKTQFEKL